jgi:hypothetical protein
MDRLTLEQARARITANAAAAYFDPAEIDWTQPDREALIIAGRMGATVSQDEQSALMAIALALLGYQSYRDVLAGQESEREAHATWIARRAAGL